MGRFFQVLSKGGCFVQPHSRLVCWTPDFLSALEAWSVCVCVCGGTYACADELGVCFSTFGKPARPRLALCRPLLCHGVVAGFNCGGLLRACACVQRFWYSIKYYVEMKFDTVIIRSLWHFMFQCFNLFFFLGDLKRRRRVGTGRDDTNLLFFSRCCEKHFIQMPNKFVFCKRGTHSYVLGCACVCLWFFFKKSLILKRHGTERAVEFSDAPIKTKLERHMGWMGWTDRRENGEIIFAESNKDVAVKDLAH